MSFLLECPHCGLRDVNDKVKKDYVKISVKGDSPFKEGQIVTRTEYEAEVAKLEAEKKKGRDRELPQETGQTRALHFAKGCYLGQEIVERIRSRGNVHRIFSAFRLDGELPLAGATLEADNKPVGELTSVAAIPLPADGGSNLQLALGYIRREALDRNLPLHYVGGIAVPVALPFSAAAPSVPQSASNERV